MNAEPMATTQTFCIQTVTLLMLAEICLVYVANLNGSVPYMQYTYGSLEFILSKLQLYNNILYMCICIANIHITKDATYTRICLCMYTCIMCRHVDFYIYKYSIYAYVYNVYLALMM